MKCLLRFMAKTTFFLLMVFVFCVLFQYGHQQFFQNAVHEWNQWQRFPSFLANLLHPAPSVPPENPVQP